MDKKTKKYFLGATFLLTAVIFFIQIITFSFNPNVAEAAVVDDQGSGWEECRGWTDPDYLKEDKDVVTYKGDREIGGLHICRERALRRALGGNYYYPEMNPGLPLPPSGDKNKTKPGTHKQWYNWGLTETKEHFLSEDTACGLGPNVCKPKPSKTPTVTATIKPSHTPTVKPSHTPTVKPSATPTTKPSATPTTKPSHTPTAKPSATPTTKPSHTPTTKPSATPTTKPSHTPTTKPSATPTTRPSHTPTAKPSATPTTKPSHTPTVRPSATPTTKPSHTPTVNPSATPTHTVTVSVTPTVTVRITASATPVVTPTPGVKGEDTVFGFSILKAVMGSSNYKVGELITYNVVLENSGTEIITKINMRDVFTTDMRAEVVYLLQNGQRRNVTTYFFANESEKTAGTINPKNPNNKTELLNLMDLTGVLKPGSKITLEFVFKAVEKNVSTCNQAYASANGRSEIASQKVCVNVNALVPVTD